MTTTIDLPGGGTATFLDSDELSNRQVKELRRSARKVGIIGQHLKDLGLDDLRTDDDTEADPESDEGKAAAEAKNIAALKVLTSLSDSEDDNLDLFQRTATAIRLTAWTLDIPLPLTPESVDDLPRPIYTAVTEEAAKLDLNESFDMEHAADPKAPAEDSAV